MDTPSLFDPEEEEKRTASACGACCLDPARFMEDPD